MSCNTYANLRRALGALWLRSACMGLLSAAVLTGCPTAGPERPEAVGDAVPEGAIPVTPDLYMLPMGVDDDGCPIFQPWSPTLMVVQALHWRTADGAFTLDRESAACPP